MNPAVFARAHGLGRDAFEPRLPPEVLAERLRAHSGMVKAVLTDQSVLAGIGNVYADEALFQAGIHPKARADRLEDRQIKAAWPAACTMSATWRSGTRPIRTRMPDGLAAAPPRGRRPVPALRRRAGAGPRSPGGPPCFCPKCQPEP